jgi:hypothetical protein
MTQDASGVGSNLLRSVSDDLLQPEDPTDAYVLVIRTEPLQGLGETFGDLSSAC